MESRPHLRPPPSTSPRVTSPEPQLAWYRHHWVHFVAVAGIALAVGCSGTDDPDPAAAAAASSDIQQLEGDVERLQADLDAALDDNTELTTGNHRLATALERAEDRLSDAQRRAGELRAELRDLTATKAEPDPAPDAAADGSPRQPAGTKASTPGGTWTVTNIVDGDTIDVRAGSGVTERVRIIGIDTPERGECGFAEAASELARTIDGQRVTLPAGARDDRDRYDRLLRYVDVGGTDTGLELIQGGYAIARYDSRDGYGTHTREDAYVAADNATTHRCGVTSDSSSSSSGPSSSSNRASASSPASNVVKKSTSDICHAPATTYYDRTTNFTAYDTLDECLASGGRLPKG